MNKYIEITVRKKTISVIADNIGNKKKEEKIIEALEQTVKELKGETTEKERYGNEIYIKLKNK